MSLEQQLENLNVNLAAINVSLCALIVQSNLQPVPQAEVKKGKSLFADEVVPVNTSKSKTKTTPKAEPVVEYDEEEADELGDEDIEKAEPVVDYTIKNVQAALMQLRKEKGKDASSAVLKAFRAERLDQLKEKDFSAIMSTINDAMQAEDEE